MTSSPPKIDLLKFNADKFNQIQELFELMRDSAVTDIIEINSLKNQINKLTIAVNVMKGDMDRLKNEIDQKTRNWVQFKNETTENQKPTTTLTIISSDSESENSHNVSQITSNQNSVGQDVYYDYPRSRSRIYDCKDLYNEQEKEPKRNYSNYNNQQNPRFGRQVTNDHQKNNRHINPNKKNLMKTKYNPRTKNICYYHNKFKAAAKRCDPPCKMQSCRPKERNYVADFKHDRFSYN